MPFDRPEDNSNLPPLEVQLQPAQPSRYQTEFDNSFNQTYKPQGGLPQQAMRRSAKVPTFR